MLIWRQNKIIKDWGWGGYCTVDHGSCAEYALLFEFGSKNLFHQYFLLRSGYPHAKFQIFKLTFS